MAVTPDTIDEYFNRYGWSFQRIDDNNWRTGFRGDVSNYTIRIQTYQNWIFFMIIPFALAPKKECWPRLFYYILRANQEMNAAKFYLDSDNDITLAVELPTDHFDYEEFERAMNVLSYQADEHYLAVLNLAQSADAPSKFETQAAAAAGGESGSGTPQSGTGGDPTGSTGGGDDLDWGDGGGSGGSGGDEGGEGDKK